MQGNETTLDRETAFRRLETTLEHIRAVGDSFLTIQSICMRDGSDNDSEAPMNMLTAGQLGELFEVNARYIDLLVDACVTDCMSLSADERRRNAMQPSAALREAVEAARAVARPSDTPAVDLGNLAEIVLVDGRRFAAVETVGEAAALAAARAGYEVFRDGQPIGQHAGASQPAA